jgi:hypothetical protein
VVALFKKAREIGLEGIVSKRRLSAYPRLGLVFVLSSMRVKPGQQGIRMLDRHAYHD